MRLDKFGDYVEITRYDVNFFKRLLIYLVNLSNKALLLEAFTQAFFRAVKTAL